MVRGGTSTLSKRSFNPYPVEDPVGGDAPVTIEFDYQDIPHISILATIKPNLTGKLLLPRAREVRIVITPSARPLTTIIRISVARNVRGPVNAIRSASRGRIVAL